MNKYVETKFDFFSVKTRNHGCDYSLRENVFDNDLKFEEYRKNKKKAISFQMSNENLQICVIRKGIS